MKVNTLATAAAVVGSASAMTCENVTVPIHASARNGVFDIKAPATDIEVTNFILDLNQQGKNFTMDSLKGYNTVSGNYELAGTYCYPSGGSSYGSSAPKTLQILTHGIGFDRSYWNIPYNNGNYSYSAVATDKYGYATFAWDRLGIGMSSHGDPVNEIQALLEVDALRALTETLRSGAVSCVKKPEKVVHVGHSFGSEHTYALTAMYPNISDGIALTGFSQNGSFIPDFAFGGNFVKVPAGKGYVDGYFAAGDASAVQTNFFAPGEFDPKILPFAYNTGQPVTVGELLTIGGETGSKNNFPGPVVVVTGERDIPYCGGNCLAPPTGFTSIPEAAKTSFLKTKEFKAVIIPKSGHGLNLEYTHPTTYAAVNDFFKQNVQ